MTTKIILRVRKIAGRGKIGDQNWGFDPHRNPETCKAEYEELKRHIGEIILLSGGGGSEMNLAVLEDVTWNEKFGAAQCKLSHITPPIGNRRTLNPIMNSWQISIII